MEVSSVIADIIQIVNRSHSDLQGLTEDDHERYFDKDGTKKATGDFDLDLYDILTPKLSFRGGTFEEFEVMNRAKNDFKGILLSTLGFTSRLEARTDNAFIDTDDSGNSKITIRAQITAGALTEIARMSAGDEPTFDLLKGRLTGQLKDANSVPGADGEVLKSKGAGVAPEWAVVTPVFGAWDSEFEVGAIYHPSVPGFVCVIGSVDTGASWQGNIRTDSQETPQIERARMDMNFSALPQVNSMMCPVRANDYWKVEMAEGEPTYSIQIYWIPFG